jgi:hypothetical protein
MRPMLILIVTVMQLLVSGACVAEGDSSGDCRKSCVAERLVHDLDCPVSENQVSPHCLHAGEKAFTRCVDACPPPSSPPSVIRPSIKRYEA